MIDRTVLSAVAVGLCLLAGGPAHAGATQEEAAAAIAAAESAREQSAALKHEWNTVAPLIAEAQAAAESGAYDDAVALAGRAKYQSEAAIAQARHESDNWQKAVVR
jgi:hypothetical protein